MKNEKPERASLSDWMTVLTGVLGVFITYLDIGISNISILDIQGSLSTGVDETTRISTAFLIGEIIIIPIAAWLGEVFSTRRVLFASSIGLMLSTVACGLSTSLLQMTIFRFFQGLSCGSFVPLATQLIVKTLPPAQRATGLIIYGMALAAGWILGPALGGFITAKFGWKYSYFMQVFPIAILVSLIHFYIRQEKTKLELLKDGDWIGILTTIICLSTFIYVLEEGSNLNWFDDKRIVACTAIAIVSFIAFLYFELTSPHPYLNLRLFKQRNFMFSTIGNFLNGMIVFGGNFAVARYLLQVQKYDAYVTSGLLLINGLPMLILGPTMPYLFKRVEDKRIIAGVGLSMYLTWAYLNSFMSHDTGYDQLFITQLLRAIGGPLVINSLTTMAFSDISKSDSGSASGLFAMMRDIGGSVGVALFSSVLISRYQFHFSRIGETVTPDSAVTQDFLNGMAEKFSAVSTEAHNQALRVLWQKIERESLVMSFADIYVIIEVIAICMLTVIFLNKSRRQTQTA